MHTVYSMCIIATSIQAREFQKTRCLLHDEKNDGIGILEDHQCREQGQMAWLSGVMNRRPLTALPSTLVATLDQHTDEVWMVRFSPSGRLLASASCDKTVIVWDVLRRAVKYTLGGHLDGVCSCVNNRSS